MSVATLIHVGLPVLIQAVGEILKGVDHPAARTASAALSEVKDAISRGQISAEQMAEMNRHAEKLAEMELAERGSAIAQVNESLRAEVASSDPYVRRMRPTFGYMIAFTWAAQMMAVAYVIVFDTPAAMTVIGAMESLGTIWAVALSVMGIYVYKRSEEKRIVTEAPPAPPAPKIPAQAAAKPRYNP